MGRLIFLDRDGVVCEEKNLLCKKEELVLLPRAVEAIRLLNRNNEIVIVVTNQPVVARGLCTEKDVQEMNEYLERLLKENEAHVDRFYYCPHHPKKGDNPEYTRECECRKPKPGMLLQAKQDLGLETLADCYMVGDTIGDILAGERAGCKTILVKTGYGGKGEFNDAVPMFEADDLYDAVVKIILAKK